jgi:hypothetical protein
VGADSVASSIAPPHCPPIASPLHEAQNDQQDRRQRAGRSVSGQAADQRRAGTHDQQRDHQYALASKPVAEVAEQNSAHGSREEADRECAERCDQRDERRHVGGEEHGRNTSAAAVP